MIQTLHDADGSADEGDVFESKNKLSVTGVQQQEDWQPLRPATTKLPSIVELMEEETVETFKIGKRRLKSQKFEDYDDSIISSVFVYKT